MRRRRGGGTHRQDAGGESCGRTPRGRGRRGQERREEGHGKGRGWGSEDGQRGRAAEPGGGDEIRGQLGQREQGVPSCDEDSAEYKGERHPQRNGDEGSGYIEHPARLLEPSSCFCARISMPHILLQSICTSSVMPHHHVEFEVPESSLQSTDTHTLALAVGGSALAGKIGQHPRQRATTGVPVPARVGLVCDKQLQREGVEKAFRAVASGVRARCSPHTPFPPAAPPRLLPCQAPLTAALLPPTGVPLPSPPGALVLPLRGCRLSLPRPSPCRFL